jgi:hypothetical protein
VCDKLLFIIVAPFVWNGRTHITANLTQGALFVKYYSIAFAILPSLAGGLALELESELTRKEKALAEMTVMFTALKKKVNLE